MFCGKAEAAEVTLKWNTVDKADGYKVYYGAESQVYNEPEDAGDNITHTLTLDPGTYYFAVTAYNNYGESGYSIEIRHTIFTNEELEAKKPDGVTFPELKIMTVYQFNGKTIVIHE